MNQPQLELEAREWLDRLAIQDLINRYCDAVTRGDWDQCEAVFAPDAVWESPLGLRFESRAAFLAMLKPTTSNDVLIQTPHSSVITLTGPDRARATTTIHELSRGKAPADSELAEAGGEINIEQYGIYYDDLTRINGEWKFTRRVFVPIYIETGGVTGEVFTRRSALLEPE
jgi:ketosteroid isomerase-like protein